MSYWVADVGIIKIKPELQKEFGFLYRGEYDKITDAILNDFLDSYSDCKIRKISDWKHHNEKEEWNGKYHTMYDENGIFTYGISYNQHGVDELYMSDFWDDILPYVADVTIYKDGWCEPI